jgi:P27 family predicted phage terminase small subunit
MNNYKKTPNPSIAPKSLSVAARKIWKSIIEDFEVGDSAGLLLLSEALTAYDEVRKAEAILASQGTIVKDKWGQLKQHPANLNLRDARNLMLRCLKALNLDIAPASPLLAGRK